MYIIVDVYINTLSEIIIHIERIWKLSYNYIIKSSWESRVAANNKYKSRETCNNNNAIYTEPYDGELW